jgi:hypothetical protein
MPKHAYMMKITSILLSTLFAASAFVFLSSCSGQKKEEAADSHEGHDHATASSDTAAALEASAPQFQVDAAFQQQLGSVFTVYVELKDAFISSDAGLVKEKANITAETLAKVDMKLLTDAAHNDWMAYLAPIQSSIKEIQTSSDIEAQRKAFSTLSDNLYKSIKAFGLGGKEAYYEFCPMAFNNEGAYWLSDQQQIRNPYFGDKMLTCGVVKEKLQ